MWFRFFFRRSKPEENVPEAIPETAEEFEQTRNSGEEDPRQVEEIEPLLKEVVPRTEAPGKIPGGLRDSLGGDWSKDI